MACTYDHFCVLYSCRVCSRTLPRGRCPRGEGPTGAAQEALPKAPAGLPPRGQAACRLRIDWSEQAAAEGPAAVAACTDTEPLGMCTHVNYSRLRLRLQAADASLWCATGRTAQVHHCGQMHQAPCVNVNANARAARVYERLPGLSCWDLATPDVRD